jgi:hypothetical protein
MSRDVRVLHVPDCPNTSVAIERIRAASSDARITAVGITSDADAAIAGMRGSPTILIDGTDPFTAPGTPTGIACRIVPGGDPVPSVEELRAALVGRT